MDDWLIATVPKNAREEIRVALREYRGHKTVDMRVLAISTSGEYVATPKGVGIKPALLLDLITARQEAKDEARAAGKMEAGA